MTQTATPSDLQSQSAGSFHGLVIEESGSYIADMVVSQRGNLAMRQLSN